jgi:hypothetical protein
VVYFLQWTYNIVKQKWTNACHGKKNIQPYLLITVLHNIWMARNLRSTEESPPSLSDPNTPRSCPVAWPLQDPSSTRLRNLWPLLLPPSHPSSYLLVLLFLTKKNCLLLYSLWMCPEWIAEEPEPGCCSTNILWHKYSFANSGTSAVDLTWAVKPEDKAK